MYACTPTRVARRDADRTERPRRARGTRRTEGGRQPSRRLYCAPGLVRRTFDCTGTATAGRPHRQVDIMPSDADVVVNAAALTALIERMLESAGSTPAEAAVVASHLVAANVKGHDSHGVGMMGNYTDQLLNGAESSFGCPIVPNEQPTIVLDTGSMLIMEAGGSFGQASARAAMEAAVKRAKSNGICMLGLRNANHIGRVGTYGEIATAHGLVSLHFVNVYHTLVAPWGGTDQRFGTNPICLAVPGTKENPGVQLDMATSIGAMGKVAVAFRAGKEMPEGWLIDSQGTPTTDPSVMHAGTFENPGKAGALLPFGTYKGWGLSFFCELLGASLIGASTIANKDVAKTTKRVNSMMAIIIDPLVAQTDGPGTGLAAEIDELVAYAKASGPGVEIPNEQEQRYEAERLSAGVSLDPETWRQLTSCATQLGVSDAALGDLVNACLVTSSRPTMSKL